MDKNKMLKIVPDLPIEYLEEVSVEGMGNEFTAIKAHYEVSQPNWDELVTFMTGIEMFAERNNLSIDCTIYDGSYEFVFAERYEKPKVTKKKVKK